MPEFGTITTITGTGAPGYSGDGGLAEKAQINNPFFCLFDLAGNLYIAEGDGNVVRRIENGSGRISTIVGSGRRGYDGDDGLATKAAFNNLVAIAVADTGDIYIVDRLNSRVRRYEVKTGIVTTVAGDGTKAYGGDGGPGTKAQLKEPHDCVFDGKGGLLIADVADCRVRRLDLKAGVITTFAGTGVRTRSGDGGPAVKASFAGSRALAVDPRNGDVYVVEREGNAIRRIDGRTGIVTPFAGTGKKGYEGDRGPAKAATFNGPKGLYCDAKGNLYVVDTENHAIRCIDAATGVIATVAGGRRGPEGDGGPAKAASLNRPHGVCIGPDGALYIADSENHRIRRAAPTKG
jgi:DNA-binding beta-propeller fold protein YncE